MVGDHEERLAVEGELAGQRLAAGVNAALVGSMRPGLNESSRLAAVVDDRRRRRRAAARAVDEREAAVGAEEEADADVAARLAAVLVVDRVDLAELVGRPAGGRDGGDELVERRGGIDDAVVGGAVVVLDLLEREDVRRAQVVDDQAGERLELRRGVARVEVLDVERADRELVRARARVVTSRVEAVVDARERRGDSSSKLPKL